MSSKNISSSKMGEKRGKFILNRKNKFQKWFLYCLAKVIDEQRLEFQKESFLDVKNELTGTTKNNLNLIPQALSNINKIDVIVEMIEQLKKQESQRDKKMKLLPLDPFLNFKIDINKFCTIGQVLNWLEGCPEFSMLGTPHVLTMNTLHRYLTKLIMKRWMAKFKKHDDDEDGIYTEHGNIGETVEPEEQDCWVRDCSLTPEISKNVKKPKFV
jgi:Cft2 family RNA processing exonuclease